MVRVFRGILVASCMIILSLHAASAKSCFSRRDLTELYEAPLERGVQYMLGIDRFLAPISVWFLPGKVCGITYDNPVPIRFEGTKINDSKISLIFLAPPPLQKY